MMHRMILAAAVALAACSSDSSSTTPDGPVAEPDKLVRACAIVNACMGTDITNCVYTLGTRGTEKQLACLFAATAGDCDAANACIGAKRSVDSNCTPGCIADNTLVRCDLAGRRTELSCGSYIESTGPLCIVADGRAACGTGVCGLDEYACTGTVLNRCVNGIASTYDCGLDGRECVPEHPGCLPPVSGTCDEGFFGRCNGDALEGCEGGVLRRYDCSLATGATCISNETPTGSSFVCGYGNECYTDTGTCIGNTLQACVAGAIFEVDCIGIGAAGCAQAGAQAYCNVN